MGNVFCILCNFIVHFRHMFCSLFYKLTYVRRICKRSLSTKRLKILLPEINKECFKWDYNEWDYNAIQKQWPKVFYKKAVLKNFAIFTGKHLCWSVFFIKWQNFSPATLLKRDSNTGLFLWVLRNFKEHLFWRISANCCFYIFQVNYLKRL